MSEPAHAPFSPSASERWLACPGSWAEEQKYPDRSSAAAEEGTFAHSIASRCLLTGTDPDELIGTAGGGFVVDEDMAEHLRDYVDYCAELQRGGLIDGPWIEERVRVSADCWGTLDFAVLTADKVLEVVDLKFGRGVYVDPHENSQGKLYALGCVETLGLEKLDVRKVRVHMFQPRHHEAADNEPFEVCVAELRRWERMEVNPAIELAQSDDPPKRSGDHCRFCRALPHCNQAHKDTMKRALQLLPGSHEVVDLPSVDTEKLAEVLTLAPRLRRLLDACEQEATARVTRGDTVPGYKLVRKVTRRRWADKEKAEAKLALVLGEDAYKRDVISPAQAEKLGLDVSNLTEKPLGDLTIAPETDKRPTASNPTDLLSDLET